MGERGQVVSRCLREWTTLGLCSALCSLWPSLAGSGCAVCLSLSLSLPFPSLPISIAKSPCAPPDAADSSSSFLSAHLPKLH